MWPSLNPTRHGALSMIYVRFWPKADTGWCSAHVRFGPKADIAIAPRNVFLLTQSGNYYLPSFQISAASFHSPRTFSHTTRYFPEISFGVASLVIKLNVPVSRAAWGLNRLTSRVVTFGLLTCSARPFHIAPIAALPFTIAEPGGNAIASTV